MASFRTFLVAAAATLILGGCAGRPSADVLDPVAPVAGLKLRTIYAASTRTPESGRPTAFTDGRSSAVSYARYVISIPPGHRAGSIEWPKAKADPATSFAVIASTPLSEARFVAETTAAAARARGPRRDVALFVHGYNYNFQESLFRLAQMEADADVGGAAVVFAWPSKAALAGYVADKESVTFSRDGLSRVVTLLTEAPGSGGVTLVGHSMGGWLTMEAIRQLRLQRSDDAVRKLNDVVLAAPDIDVDVFRQQLRVIGRLQRPITLLVSKDDKALAASRLLSGDRGRVGALDVDDPAIHEAARAEGVRVVDISQLASENGSDHDRYTALAAIYPKLQSQLAGGSSAGVSRAGVFILDAAASTISSPFRIAGQALRGRQ
ncbi:alpha/beta hydrolase [Hansschlegelia sp. KR7-227]|uniref:alpha/beta hydrolase n=1 Tax=Hansschlegelia sp. KR7-227 TaxID=3400914 RepID=UPI003BFFEED0